MPGQRATLPRTVPGLWRCAGISRGGHLSERLVPVLNDALGVAPGQSPRCWPFMALSRTWTSVGRPAFQIFLEIGGNGQTGVELAARERFAEFADRAIGAGEIEAATLRHVGDEIPAMGRVASSTNAELEMADRRIQREAEED